LSDNPTYRPLFPERHIVAERNQGGDLESNATLRLLVSFESNHQCGGGDQGP
jgi:hypothetical protein